MDILSFLEISELIVESRSHEQVLVVVTHAGVHRLEGIVPIAIRQKVGCPKELQVLEVPQVVVRRRSPYLR